MPASNSGSGDGGGGISHLEKRIGAVEGKIDLMGKDISGIRSDLSELKGRVMSMPTMWQLVGLVFAIMGGAYAIIRFGMGR